MTMPTRYLMEQCDTIGRLAKTIGESATVPVRSVEVSRLVAVASAILAEVEYWRAQVGDQSVLIVDGASSGGADQSS